jgi:hypothetical protein
MDFVRLIQEGRVDDFKAKYSQKFGNNVNNIVSKVPHKFLDWVGKNLDNINFEENLDKLSNALNKFEKISTNLPITDLYQYKSVGQLLSALTEYEQRLRRKVKPVSGGNVVYDDGRYFIVNPLTLDSSCYYGKGTKWCTAATNNQQFSRYNEDGKLFYIMDRTLPTSDPYYKVALLKKFDGDKTFYDAKDDVIRSGWLWNSNKLKEILDTVDDYMNKEYPEQIKIYSDKVSAKREKERLQALETQRILRGRRNEAEERRLDDWWSLDDPACPEEGLKAHALLEWLVDNNDVDVITNEDRVEMERIQTEIERLQAEYDNSDEPRTDLLDEISDLEDELSEFNNRIDVYNIIPNGEFYDTTEFIVIDAGLDDRGYAVGTEREMESSAYDNTDSLIDDIGYDGFHKSFVMNHIDTGEVVDYFRDFFDDDVRESPESYFAEEDRMLSDEQEDQISFLKRKIEVFEAKVERLDYELGGEDDDEIQNNIDEINAEIEEINDEISDIESSPEGEYPEELIETAVEDRLRDVKSDPAGYINDWGLNYDNFIDRDSFIKDVIDTDGYGNIINGYDGNADEVKVKDEWYYVMRIN